jgi:uncharacterized protein YkwD
MSKEEHQILDMVNAERGKEKLPPLAPNPVLFGVARDHSANMARKDEMSHELDGKNPAQRTLAAGYDYKTVGENLAEMEFGKPSDAQALLSPAALKDILEKWMASPDHRKNILDKRFTETGLGLGRTEKGKVYITQVFGRPRKKPG